MMIALKAMARVRLSPPQPVLLCCEYATYCITSSILMLKLHSANYHHGMSCQITKKDVCSDVSLARATRCQDGLADSLDDC